MSAREVHSPVLLVHMVHSVQGWAMQNSKTTGTLASIQAGRAFAALIVVYLHVFENHTAEAFAYGRSYGHFGVDVFFVISGFIMARSAIERPFRSDRYLKNRFLRIYPMWWLALTIWIGLRIAHPDRLHDADLTSRTMLLSFFLLPHDHQVFHHPWPILVPGWTLQIEIFFYAVVSACFTVSSKRLAIALVVIVLAALVAIGTFFRPTAAPFVVYLNPLLLEFLGGIGLAFGLSPIRQHVPAWMAVCGLVLALLAAIPATFLADAARVATRGLPAMLLVASLLALEPFFAQRGMRHLRWLGDASYSLYLFHPIAISTAALLWADAHLPSGSDPIATAFIPLALFASLALAAVVHSFVEIPLLRWMRAAKSFPPSSDREVEATAL